MSRRNLTEEERRAWVRALMARNDIKNKELKQKVGHFIEGIPGIKLYGKIDTYKENKTSLLLVFFVNEEKNQLLHTVVHKVRGTITKEDRLKALIYLSSTGKLFQFNQSVLESFFNVAQSTIANDIKHLREEGLLYSVTS